MDIRRRATAAVIAALAVGTALVAAEPAAAAPSPDCTWLATARALAGSLEGATGPSAARLRAALTRAGVTATSPVTPGCAAPAQPPQSHGVPPQRSAPVTAPVTGPASGDGATAAAAYGWGTPVQSDDFSNGLGQWGLYNGPGHAGNGRRIPSAASVAGGVLTITGDSQGNSEGMAWGNGQKYGRWEARVRSTAGDESYHPVMLLWPDAENWPVGGEVDWMEISAADRQDADSFLHYGSSNNQVSGTVKVDATRWHNWAVEWTPQGITTYLDGKVWWSTKDTSILPPGPMHMTIQLDYFGGGNPKTSQMQVDWVKQYALGGGR